MMSCQNVYYLRRLSRMHWKDKVRSGLNPHSAACPSVSSSSMATLRNARLGRRLADRSKTAFYAGRAVCPGSLIFGRVVPGDRRLAIDEADNRTVFEGWLSSQDLPGAPADELASKLFANGA